MANSPCVNLCRMDPESGLCAGCYRTLEEITGWSQASDEEQRRIVVRVLQRRLQDTPPKNKLTGNKAG